MSDLMMGKAKIRYATGQTIKVSAVFAIFLVTYGIYLMLLTGVSRFIEDALPEYATKSFAILILVSFVSFIVSLIKR